MNLLRGCATAAVLFALVGPAGTAAQTTDPVPQATPPTDYELGTSWFSRDKFYHFSISAVGSGSVYTASRYLGIERVPSAVGAIAIVGTVGFLRETFEREDPNLLTRTHFSSRDMFWNGVGIAVGLVVGEVLSPARREREVASIREPAPLPRASGLTR